MRCLSCALVCVIALLFTGSHAAGQKQSADGLIEQAASQYAELNFEAALKLLNKALQVKGNSRSQLVRIHHLTGLCLGAIGRYNTAKRAFERLLSLDPTFRLGADVSPRVRKPFDEFVRSTPQPLEVRPLPAGHAQPGKPVSLTFRVVADPVKMAKAIRVWHRRGASGKYSSVRSRLDGKGEYLVTIPALAWEGGPGTQGKLFWYAVVEGDLASRLQAIGDAAHPISLEVIDQATAEKLADAKKSWYERWWVWAIIGGVVAAGTTTAVVLATSATPAGAFDFDVVISTQ